MPSVSVRSTIEREKNKSALGMEEREQENSITDNNNNRNTEQWQKRQKQDTPFDDKQPLGILNETSERNERRTTKLNCFSSIVD